MGKNLKGQELGKGLGQRKDGRYEARTMVNGVSIRIYDSNLAKLKKALEFERAKALRNELNERPNITLSEWFEEWFETCKSPQLKNQQSRSAYSRKVRNTYINVLGSKKISLVSQIDIQKAANELFNDGYTYRVLKEALGILKECFNIAIVNHLVTVNPCQGINLQGSCIQQKDERRILEHWEQEIFIDEVKDRYFYEAYMVLLLTGMRIGEFSGLQWGDIDFNKKIILINRSLSTAYVNGKKIQELTTPKTPNSYRKIPFFGETEKFLKSWKLKQDSYKSKLKDRWRAQDEFGDLVFTSTLGSPASRYVISSDLTKIVRDINLKEMNLAFREGRAPREFKGLYPHAFRHTFATRCFERKMDPIFIQKIMGHSNYSTTISYTHILEKTQQFEMAKTIDFLDTNNI